MIIPPALKSGETIGVMAPSSYVEAQNIEASKAVLEERGYKVFIHPQTYERQNQSAGTHEQKLEALHDLWGRDDIRAIWAAGGGNRGLYLLDQLDLELIESNPKPFIGFSDSTALLNHIYAQTGLITFHGPVFKNVHQYGQLDHVLELLSSGTAKYPLDQTSILKDGTAEGPLVGGNLSIVQYLSGDFYKGAILFLEDCNEELSRIDRMFAHLKRSGVFNQISGLILGEFLNLQDTGRPFGFSLEDIIRENTDDLDIPVILNAPFGHGDSLFTMPVGTKCRLSTNPLELTLSESAVNP